MQPLAATREIMIWLSMCPPDETSNATQRKRHTACTWAVLIINLIDFFASLTFCLDFIRSDFDSSTFAFCCAVGEFGLIYFFITAIRMRLQIDEIFNGLSTIYNSSE